MMKLFTDHPRSVNETYLQHFAFASKTGLKLIVAGSACVLHAIFPFWFKRTASNCILQLADVVKPRSEESENNS